MTGCGGKMLVIGIRDRLIDTIRSTVSDSSFRFRFIFRLNMKPGYKMWNCSVPFHGINVIHQGHPSSDYCAFDKTIL